MSSSARKNKEHLDVPEDRLTVTVRFTREKKEHPYILTADKTLNKHPRENMVKGDAKQHKRSLSSPRTSLSGDRRKASGVKKGEPE
jgi:hypothetical protein